MEELENQKIQNYAEGSGQVSVIRFKKLVLQGFKSFSEQTELVFNDTICAIVGPNGCGKSNILDALRWVLGEQGPSQLRARTMSDVIFNGAANRKPVGMAEITLMIECSPGSMPVSFEEIAITRRLYRSGESEYLLNRTPCRLKDITDLFLDTGIGKGAYSLIEQGRVDALITSRPDERRGFLEQIAGIEKYKVRKKEALSRLATTENNLARVRDVVSEVKSRRVSLARQARKASRYRILSKEMESLQRVMTGGRCAKIMASLRHLAIETSRIENAIARNAASQALQTVALTESAKQTELAQVKLQQAADEYARTESRIDTIESRIHDIDHRRSEREAEIEHESREATKLDFQSNSLADRSCHLETERVHLNTRYRTLEKNVDGLAGKLQETETSVSRIQTALSGARSQRLREIAEWSELQHRIVSYEERLEDLKQRLKQRYLESCRLGEEEQAIRVQYSGTQSRINELELAQKDLKDRTDETQKLRQEAFQKKDAAEQKGRGIEKERFAFESRMESLKEIDASGEGLDEGVRQVLKNFGQYRQPEFPGIFGTVADLYDTPDEYEVPVAAALYPYLQDIVVADVTIADEICCYLISEKPGRARVRELPETGYDSTADTSGPDAMENLPFDIVPLRDLVTSDTAFEHLFDVLLYNVFMVLNEENAARAARQYPNAVVVTHCGVCRGPGRVRTIGRSVDNRPAFRRRKKEIRELKCRISEYREREADAKKELDEQVILSRRMDSDWQELQSVLVRINQDIAVAKGEHEHTGMNLRQTNQRQVTVQGDIEVLEHEIQTATRQLDECRKKLSDTDHQTDSSGTIESLEARLQSVESERNTLRETLTEQRIQMRSANDRAEFVTREQARLQDEIKRLANMAEQYRQQSVQKRALLESDNDRRRELTCELEELVEKSPVSGKRVETLKAQMEQARLAQQALSQDVAELEKTDRLLEREKTEIRVGTASLEAALAALREDSVWNPGDEAGKLGRVPDDTEIQDWKEQLEKLQNTLSLFSDVNLAAEQEHQELVERNRFLEEQLQDMEHAIHSLRSTIQQINRTSKTRFMNALEVVNHHFGVIFQGLFGGGEAALDLIDPDNPLESGIDIVCKPPGKRARTIDLLSGGEKALAALALLLAGFKYRPSPLLFLDEVDAPLDENNVTRFTTFLRKLSEMTQVVMITHNPLTMEAADVLYGVTMEEPGISKLVSARLNVFSA